MTRVITIAGTAITSTSDLDSIKVGGQAKQGDSALSEIIVYDDTNSLFGTAESFIRKQWSVTENASGTAVYLARGRIAAFETHRGEEDSVQSATVQYTWALEDANLELRGLDVDGWERPEETGRARVVALGTAYLNGSPRATTNLDTTTYVPNTNTVTMPAKTYNNTDAFEVIAECAAAEDKKFFVTVDHELFYDLESSTSYVAGLEISDGVGAAADPDGTNYFAPVWDLGSALSWEGQNYASRLRLTYNQDFSVLVTDSASQAAHDYWTAHVADTETTTAAMATAFANAELNYRKGGERTYALSLKIPAAQAYKLKYGQLIWIHSQAAVDTTARVQRRIAELMWEPAGPYWYIARLNLDRPVRRRIRGSVSGPTPTGPKPAPICAEDTIVSPTTIWSWTWTTNENDDGTNTYDGGLDRTVPGGFGDYAPATAAFDGPYGRNNASAFASQAVPISASTLYSFRADILYRYTPSNRPTRIFWYDGGGSTLRTDVWESGVGRATNVEYHIVGTFTSPVGAATLKIDYDSSAGVYVDNVFIETPGSVVPADNDEFCIPYGPNESPYYVPSDTVVAQLASLEQQIAALEDSADANDIDHLEIEHRFRISGHRGDIGSADSYPENTLESVLQTALKGADSCEIDVKRSSEGTWWLMHDSTVDRTTDGSGAPSSLTDAALAALNIDGGLGYDAGRHGTSLNVPTLAAVLDAVRPYNFPLVLHLVTGVAEAEYTALAEYIVANELQDRVWVLCGLFDGASAVKAVDARIQTMTLTAVSDDPQTEPDIDIWLARDTEVTSLAVITAKAPEQVWSIVSADDYGIDEGPSLQDAWDFGCVAFMTNNLDAALDGRAALVGSAAGAAGGDLSGTYPNPSVVDDSHNHTASTAPGGGVGAILISDTPSTPLVFADLIQNEAQDDLVYADI